MWASAAFDASANKYLYNHNGQKYFVPASNTKLFSCYAALKYLGDSLPGLRYWENDTASVPDRHRRSQFVAQRLQKTAGY